MGPWPGADVWSSLGPHKDRRPACKDLGYLVTESPMTTEAGALRLPPSLRSGLTQAQGPARPTLGADDSPGSVFGDCGCSLLSLAAC